jgi:hypothetical protein
MHLVRAVWHLDLTRPSPPRQRSPLPERTRDAPECALVNRPKRRLSIGQFLLCYRACILRHCPWRVSLSRYCPPLRGTSRSFQSQAAFDRGQQHAVYLMVKAVHMSPRISSIQSNCSNTRSKPMSLMSNRPGLAMSSAAPWMKRRLAGSLVHAHIGNCCSWSPAPQDQSR